MKINKDGIQKFQSGGLVMNKPILGKYQNVPIAQLIKDGIGKIKDYFNRDSFSKDGFGGGSFGASGAGGEWGNEKPQPVNWLESKIPLEGPSFNEAFANARKNKLKQFNFNGKTYTTDVGKTWDPNKGNVRENLRLRTVLDNDNLLIRDSTRIEPELGQQVFKRIDMTERRNDLAKRRKEVRGW